ncbi:MAG: 50S ribosomal protein L4 [Alphaproteobacteria bacterium]|jgi:large subunit ribosomal protein L4|nr:50S ribosomal protein L4 [Alphaproteobacteria bacterium]MCV6599538.1 50S ribosomal protein L4 [Alphaproteobacteria bacterium]
MKLAVVNLQNEKVGDITLSKDIFGLEPRADILHRMVNWQLAKRRSGNHKTKQRGEVAGTTKKMFRQKGTGSARAGNKKAPQRRGGGIAFGPVVRSHSHDLTKKFRIKGLKTALSAKAKEKKIVILDKAVAKNIKTKEMAVAMNKLGLNSALFVCGEEVDTNFAKSVRNIPLIDVLPVQGANVYDILRRDTLVLTEDAVKKLEERLN